MSATGYTSIPAATLAATVASATLIGPAQRDCQVSINGNQNIVVETSDNGATWVSGPGNGTNGGTVRLCAGKYLRVRNSSAGSQNSYEGCYWDAGRDGTW